MTCAYAPSGAYVACGGLDNICSIYRLDATIHFRILSLIAYLRKQLVACRLMELVLKSPETLVSRLTAVIQPFQC